MSIIQGTSVGQKVVDGKVVETRYEAIDTDQIPYHWTHNIFLTSDWKNPSPEDQKKLDKIKLKEYVFNDKGKLKKARFCPKCLACVFYTKQP